MHHVRAHQPTQRRKAIDRVRQENATCEILHLKEDLFLIAYLGSNEEGAREAATAFGQSLPDVESGLVVI